ncbi:hypothetical protein [Muricoccus vinaceus]|uniref:Uncharacterized protein n=1 Tax=Muricoccus vinaceus TaxID=424704 RepID=A0ABV6IS69_9PROT
MHVLFRTLARLFDPLWSITRTRPWLSVAILGGAAAICYFLEIPYLRTFLALAAASVLIVKAEADRREHMVTANLASDPAR